MDTLFLKYFALVVFVVLCFALYSSLSDAPAPALLCLLPLCCYTKRIESGGVHFPQLVEWLCFAAMSAMPWAGISGMSDIGASQ